MWRFEIGDLLSVKNDNEILYVNTRVDDIRNLGPLKMGDLCVVIDRIDNKDKPSDYKYVFYHVICELGTGYVFEDVVDELTS